MGNGEQFRAGIEALNARDWTAYRKLLANDVTYEDYATGVRLNGVDAFVGLQQQQLAAFPDESIRILSMAAEGSLVFGELLAEGTHTGPLATPAGDMIPATGRRFSVRVVTVAEYDDEGLVRTSKAYFNPLEQLDQLGLTATPQAIDLTTTPETVDG